MVEIEQLKLQLGERIYNPTVREVFEEYIKYGCLDHYKQIIDGMPYAVAQAVVKVQSTQVYKEKSLWPIFISEKLGLDTSKAAKIGAVIDLLWGVAIMIDDIFDGDKMRGDSPAAWVNIGAKKTQEFAYIAVESVFDYLSREVDSKSVKLLKEFMIRGINSVVLHRRMNIDTDYSIILNNYLNRDDFHSAFPLYALYDPKVISLQDLEGMSLGIRIFNQAGQLINDTRDVLPGAKDGTSRLSDFREGQVTVALKCLYSNLTDADKKFFSNAFGTKTIDYYTIRRIGAMAGSGNFRDQMRRRINDTYARGFSVLCMYMSEKGIKMLEEWIRYKTGILGDL